MKNKVVPFKGRRNLPFPLLQRLKEAGQEFGLENVYLIRPEDIVIAEWVGIKCRYGCSRYNRSWCCPPATPPPDKVRQILSEYSEALLLQYSHCLADFYRNDANKRKEMVRCWKGTVSLERLIFLEGYHKAFSLIGENCALCKDCAYPENCLFPQEKRPSVVSFSIDVVETLHRQGITPHVATDVNEEFTYYAIILTA